MRKKMRKKMTMMSAIIARILPPSRVLTDVARVAVLVVIDTGSDGAKQKVEDTIMILSVN